MEIDIGVDIDVDMEVDSDMAVSIHWGILQEGCRAPCKGVWCENKAGLVLIPIKNTWLFP